MVSSVHLLGNPAARRGKGAAELTTIAELLRARCPSVHVLEAPGAAAAEQAAAALVAGGAERIVVAGGDGMVHLAIQAVAQTNTVLGVVATGTGNDFARGVGLPSDREAAVDAALGAATPVDLMRVGHRWAASVATAGFSVAVNARANLMKWPAGSNKYSVATVRELPRLTPLDYELTVDGETHRLRAVVVTVANTSDFGGGMRITPDADPTDGILNVTVVGEAGRLELLRWFRTVFSGTHLEHAKVSTFSGASITIAGPNTEVWADGEPVGSTPLTIEAVPGALLLAGLPPGGQGR